MGLSPPTRGSPKPDLPSNPVIGSIPAHAGKPGAAPGGGAIRRVYPRPRGEAATSGGRSRDQAGLSPPTRGSRWPRPPRRRRRGSIPAHAGKPGAWRRSWPSPWVYPRPRGEAIARRSAAVCRRGLSPPTRGSRGKATGTRCTAWSIPAHAGKPLMNAAMSPAASVYPRPRGEARGIRSQMSRRIGLSPPTRGSREQESRALPGRGSIPAHAGKPHSSSSSSGAPWVYPRPRGEAQRASAYASRSSGLSPPTRGSLAFSSAVGCRRRSIPAHAGKPSARRPSVLRRQVYPRPRGEAKSFWLIRGCPWGLSPPTRGSLSLMLLYMQWAGSIPAHAGKPSHPLRRSL